MSSSSEKIHARRLHLRAYGSGRYLVCCIIACAFFLTASVSAAAAKAKPPKIVAVVTNKTALDITKQFGDVNYIDINQSKDTIFAAGGATALFLRRANASAPTRLLQRGDAPPGAPHGAIESIGQPCINASGHSAVLVYYAAAGHWRAVVVSHNGSSFHAIADSKDTAPKSGGVAYGDMSFLGCNDAGDVAFTALLTHSSLVANERSAIFLSPGGGAPVRLVGYGDPVPGVTATFSEVTGIKMNSAGEVLFSARIVGGSGGYGLFVVTRNKVVRKVAVHGDPGIDFSYPPTGLLNAAGWVAFDDTMNGGVWLHTPSTGLVWLTPPGTPAPKFPGSDEQPTFDYTSVAAMNDAGQIAFIAYLGNNSTSGFGLYRFVPNQAIPFEIVAYAGQPAPSVPGQNLGNPVQGSVSMNNTGVISFRAGLQQAGVPRGFFQWTPGGGLSKRILEGDATLLSGGGTFGLAKGAITRTLNDGSLLVSVDVLGGQAFAGTFLLTGSNLRTITSTQDNLPAGSRLSVPTSTFLYLGNYVAYRSLRTGGQNGLWLHDLSTNTDIKVAADGDTAPGIAGGRLRVAANNLVMNQAGQVAFQARVIGGIAYGGNGIFLKAVGAPLAKVAARGDAIPGVSGTLMNLKLPMGKPPAMNDLGQVVFAAQFPGGSGVFVGSATSPPAKVALRNEPAPGTTNAVFWELYNVAYPAINRIGEVAFQAGLNFGNNVYGDGYFIGAPGWTPYKVVATFDPGPMGTTFPSPWNLGQPLGFTFNDASEVGFISGLDGYPFGPFGGVFIGNIVAAPAPVVLSGDPAPVVGDYSITQSALELAMNLSGDIVFRSALFGGNSDTGYFLRRAGTSKIVPVVVQGQAVPGQSGTFSSIVPDFWGLPSNEIALAPNGDVVFVQEFQENNVFTWGMFRFSQNNTLSKIFALGDAAPQTGGGSFADLFTSVVVNETGQVVFWAAISGGTVTEGIFITK